MSDTDARNELICTLIRKAEEDMVLLEKIVDDEDISSEIFGFHSQQAIEKLLKALLMFKIIPFRHTHDLGELIDLCSEHEIEVPDELYNIDDLTPFAVEYRYDVFTPSNKEVFSRHGALERVKEVHRWVQFQIKHPI
ncbi:MAG: HEPN domain-containing protein [Methanosarcinales archaeon]|nr:HEPN domain-containing protein [Methanosarcinales archaeon]